MMHEMIKDKIQSMRGLDSTDLLAALGLERKSSTFDRFVRATGLIAAGMLLGTGLALLFAPRSGREMRKQLRDSASTASERITHKANELVATAREALPLEASTSAREAESGASVANNGPRSKASEVRTPSTPKS